MPNKTIALIGSDSILGREVRDLLGDAPLPAQLSLLGAEEEGGILTEQQGELELIRSLEKDHLMEAEIALLAGTPESAQRAYEIVQELDPAPALIDLTYTLEDHPQARLRAPQVEPDNYTVPADAIHLVAHPAAVVLADLLRRLHDASPVRNSVVLVLEPASERGQRGLNELQQQTINVLSFKPLDKQVYDAQLSFNLLPRFGSEAAQSLEDVEARVERHLATLLALDGRAPLPSLRLVQAPVFHGYSMSLWVEFETPVNIGMIASALAADGIDVRTGSEEHPNNVGAAGQSGFVVGAIEADRNNPRALWLWAAADNLRVMADSARQIAEDLL